MDIVKCYFSLKETVQGKLYFTINEENNINQAYIPAEKIEIFNDFDENKSYDFRKYYVDKFQKTFYQILHPEYSHESEIWFTVLNKIAINDDTYAELESPFKVRLRVKIYDWQLEKKKIPCKIIYGNTPYPKLVNIDKGHPYWSIGETYDFEIIRFDSFISKKTGDPVDIIIIEHEGFQTSILQGGVFSESIWSYKNIKCKVVDIFTSNGTPKMIAFDDRNPLYKIGKAYDFEILGREIKRLNDHNEIEVLILKGEFEIKCEVKIFENHDESLTVGKPVTCRVVKTTPHGKIYLRLEDAKDPYFKRFEEIIANKDYLSKYFNDSILEENERLFNQYENHRASWVFTYCNEVIPRLKISKATSYDFSSLKEVIKISDQLQKWMYNSGFISSLNGENSVDVTSPISEQIFQSNNTQLRVLDKIEEYEKIGFENINFEILNFQELSYFIRYYDITKLNPVQVWNLVSNLSNENISVETFWLSNIKSTIYKKKHIYDKFEQENFFVSDLDINTELYSQTIKFLSWLALEVLLCRLLKRDLEKSIIISRILRIESSIVKDTAIKRKLLLNAFYFCNTKDLDVRFNLDESEMKISLDYSLLSNNPNETHFLDNIEGVQTCSVEERHYQGYKIKLGNINGFLAIQNIVDETLKRYSNMSINWNVNIKVSNYSSEFNFFLASQIERNNPDYLSDNLIKEILPEIGDVISVEVKNVVEYGVFVKTNYTDGLIHISEISENYFDPKRLYDIFPIGYVFDAQVIAKEDDKFQLSLKSLNHTEYEFDQHKFQYFDDIEIDKNSFQADDFKKQGELQIGLIFESFASTQDDLKEKIKYLKFKLDLFFNMHGRKLNMI